VNQFLYLKTVNIPTDGSVVTLDVSGSVFICTSSIGAFQVAFDGQGFCDWMKGLSAPISYSKLLFKCAPGASQTNKVEFFTGNIPVNDSRLNVINNSQLATIQTIDPRTFLTVYSDFAAKGTATNFANNRTLQLTDPVIDPETGEKFRRESVTIWNYTGGTRLYVGLGAGTGAGDVTDVFAEVDGSNDNPVPLVLKLSGNIFVGNQSGACRVRIMDKFFEDPEIFNV
jgi:hypothetical protein